MLGIIFGIIGALVVYAVFVYNKSVSLKNYLKEAFSTMDVYLKKRWDLIPNLVESVKGYAKHESGLMEKLTALRAKEYSQLSDAEKLDVNKQIGALFPQINAVAENYPDLKASQTFVNLMEQLGKIEEDIANARKYYNATVRDYNTFIQMFPANLLAAKFGFKPEVMFEINEAEREAVKVSF
jgi:LemA protein